MPASIVLQNGSAAGILLLLALLLFVVSLGLIYWVYQDAQVNSSDPAYLWALVVFFAPILGLLLYLLVGRGSR